MTTNEITRRNNSLNGRGMRIVNDGQGKGAYIGRAMYQTRPYLILADSWTSAYEILLETLVDDERLDIVTPDEVETMTEEEWSVDLDWVDGRGFVSAGLVTLATVRHSSDD